MQKRAHRNTGRTGLASSLSAAVVMVALTSPMMSSRGAAAPDA